ncbi:HTH-type transcriptional regulator YesS [Fervidicola ferrireducens]|uniref:HTH-type transcriptional regulator YesS n=1 Tax=Fervidicola ferrireducens TaxID=520764 RepID=A0A140LDQ4_9FIRM|nr:helix-turn-helix domain-containing protein [Fervidicola ferrireducens]KXG78679.1 HTH-type transcriptional regulator YesS [Fervidicola ferrireducens]
MRRLRFFARLGFLRELLSNNIESVKDIWFLLKALGINAMPNTVMVVSHDNYYTETRNKSEIQKRALRLKTIEALEEAVKPFVGLVVPMEENLFAILLETESDGEHQVKETLQMGSQIRDRVEDYAQVSVSIGIGRRYKDIHNLHLSYKEALAALNYKFFLGKSQVIHIENVLPYSDDMELFSMAVESELAVKVLSCDKEGAYSIIEDLVNSIGTAGFLNPLSIKSRFLEIFNFVVKVAFEAGGDKEVLAALCGRYIEGILRSDTLEEAREQVREFIGGIVEEVYEGRKRMNLVVFERAIRYIQENFRKPLTLEEVADHVHVSPYYFSHGFKNFTGMSFIQYVTKLRVEEAKKLLLSTNLSVKEVGKMVGYSDANYFSRVFKNEIGMPPSRFKLSKKFHIMRNFSEG